MQSWESLVLSGDSVASGGDLTSGAVKVWVGLPEEVRYDSSFEQFRQYYEREHGETDSIRSHPKSKTFSATKIQFLKDVAFLAEKKCPLCDEELHRKIPDKIIPKPSWFARTRDMIKLGLLVACWIFFTIVFFMYGEADEIPKHSSIMPGEIKSYIVEPSSEELSVLVKMEGPFLSNQFQRKLNCTDMSCMPAMHVWLEMWYSRPESEADFEFEIDIITTTDEYNSTIDNEEYDSNFTEEINPMNFTENNKTIQINVSRDDERFRSLVVKDSIQQSPHWVIILETEDKIDFTEGEVRSSMLRLRPNKAFYRNKTYEIISAIRMSCTSHVTTPFTLRFTMDPLNIPSGLLYSCILLGALYVLIIFELVNRTMAALLVSTLALSVLALVGERPSLEEMVAWLDVETLLLLFSMMIIVAIMSETGLFDFLAVYAFEVTKGKIWPLISLLSGITALLSTVLDNVTTVLLMTPVTIRLSKVMDMDPVPILLWMVLYSNIGGTVTPVGDPPNVIIASNKSVIQAGINFTNFTLHMSIGILFVCVQSYFQLRFIFRNTDKLRTSEPRDIVDLRRKISVWRRAAEALQDSGDEMVIRDRLERKVLRLSSRLTELIAQTKGSACTKDRFDTVLADIKAKYKIKDKVLLGKAGVAVTFVVITFFLHSFPAFTRVTLGWTALLGALLLLTLADRQNIEPILHSIEWSTLLFFAALFVLMEALSKLGLIDFIGDMTESLIMQVNEKARLAVAILSLLWISGISSAFVDNIPLTTMMIRVVTSLGNNATLNLPMMPLIWALSFGACLGGNGTLIGASANVVCAGVAEQHGYQITFVRFFKVGFPVMIGHLLVATVYLLFCHCLLSWH